MKTGRPCVLLGKVFFGQETPNNKEAPIERVYTIGADPHGAFTELATISPGGRVVRRDRCPTTISALVEAVSEVRRPRVMVVEEGPLADWLYRGLSERGLGGGGLRSASQPLIAKASKRVSTGLFQSRDRKEVVGAP